MQLIAGKFKYKYNNIELLLTQFYTCYVKKLICLNIYNGSQCALQFILFLRQHARV